MEGCTAPRRRTMKRHFQPFEEHALEGQREAVPVDPSARPRSAFSASRSSREDRVLVVQRLVPARAQDGLGRHCRPNTSRSAPTTRRSAFDGTSVRAGPSAATTTPATPQRRHQSDERRHGPPRARSSVLPPSRPHWRGTTRGRGGLRSCAPAKPRVRCFKPPSQAYGSCPLRGAGKAGASAPFELPSSLRFMPAPGAGKAGASAPSNLRRAYGSCPLPAPAKPAPPLLRTSVKPTVHARFRRRQSRRLRSSNLRCKPRFMPRRFTGAAASRAALGQERPSRCSRSSAETGRGVTRERCSPAAAAARPVPVLLVHP